MKKLWDTEMKQFYLKMFGIMTVMYLFFFLMVRGSGHNDFNKATLFIYGVSVFYTLINYIREFKS